MVEQQLDTLENDILNEHPESTWEFAHEDH